MMERWKKLPLALRQAFAYGLVGGLSFLCDFGFYAFLTRIVGIYFLLANLTSFVVIGTLNFLANRRFTFGHGGRPGLKQYTKFFIVAGTGLALNTGILAFAVTVLHIHDLVAKAVAAFLVFFWNFGMNRYWTFRHKPAAEVLSYL